LHYKNKLLCKCNLSIVLGRLGRLVMTSPNGVTQLLQDWKNGDKAALDKLMPVVYDELRRIASRYLKQQRSNHTLQTTALVHEAYIRLVGKQDIEWQNRAHFFGIAARMMRYILLDYAVAQQAEKRGGGNLKLSLEDVIELPEKNELDVAVLHDSLNTLAEVDERKSQIVELKFFAGLSNEDVAEVMGVSLATVNREWRMARAWLQSELQKKDDIKTP
jgi:RNA polymerase sigma factor (TIGR02999 family)